MGDRGDRFGKPRRPVPVRLVGACLVAAGGAVTAATVITRRRLRGLDRSSEEYFGLHSDATTITTPDGVDLHVEIDEAPRHPDRPTVVWVHGYALNLDNWFFQRRRFLGRYRSVFFDQRSHGRSQTSAPELDRVPQLGADLEQVITATAAERPIILVGHSMGAMAILHLARRRPEWFGPGRKVRAVGLLNTSSGQMAKISIIPGVPGPIFSAVVPRLAAVLRRAPGVVTAARSRGNDVAYLATRRIGFGTDRVPERKIEFVNAMMQRFPLENAADFYPAFTELDEHDALPIICRVPVLIVGSRRDPITPYAHTEVLAEAIPEADLLIFDGAGHQTMIEKDTEVNNALERLFAKARRTD
ncbi:alpha/beta fold hydrolase [Naumannella halotolerans]|uniref:alpha/beta fold hydrolase n=1 Tax=Naumannella halotolerans TaxID=993414 RepID=UPI00370D98B1